MSKCQHVLETISTNLKSHGPILHNSGCFFFSENENEAILFKQLSILCNFTWSIKKPEVLFRMTHKWPIVRFSEETWILIGCLHYQEDRWILIGCVYIPRILSITFQFHFKVPSKVTGTGVILQSTWVYPELSVPFYSDTDSDCFTSMPTRKTKMRKLWHSVSVTHVKKEFQMHFLPWFIPENFHELAEFESDNGKQFTFRSPPKCANHIFYHWSYLDFMKRIHC